MPDNKKIIDINNFTPKELQVIVDSYIREYHDHQSKSNTFEELSKLEDYLFQMREAGLSLKWIRQFLIDTYDYNVGVHTLSEYFKIFHGTRNQ